MHREDPPRRPRRRTIAVALGVVLLLAAGAWWLLGREEVVVRGGIADYYESAGVRDQLGEPEANERCGLAGGGCLQEFEHGTVYWAPGLETVHVAAGDILDHYTDAAGPDGDYGYPVTPVIHDDPTADFEYLRTHDPRTGKWFWLISAGEGDVVPVDASEALGARWEADREELGAPTPETAEGERCTGEDLCRQSFRDADLIWSPATGTHAISGAFRARYEDSMGAPLGEERVDADGVTVQEFSRPAEGTYEVMTWTARDGAASHTVRGGLAALYAASGRSEGELGVPVSGESSGLRDGGVRQRFAHGDAYWTPRTGSAAVTSPTALRAWRAQGSEDGAWGYPTSSKRPLDGGWAQDFEGGTVEVSGDGYSRFVPDAELAQDPGAVLDGVAAQYDLGPARGGVEQLTGGVRYREFEGGVAVLGASDGAVAMSDAVFETWRTKSDVTGAPRMAKDDDGRLSTRFTEGTLAHFPERGDMVLRVSSRLGAGDALVIGDSQLGEGDHQGSWVAQAIRDNGYTPYYEAHGGIGVATDGSRTGFGSYYQGVVDRKWILPSGDPELIYIQGSGNDSYGTSSREIEDKMTQTIRTLKETYPQSRIVVTGLISKQDASSRNRVSDVLEKVARDQGVTFVPLEGKITEWNSGSYLKDGLHFRAPDGQDYMAGKYAPYLERFLRR